jgi:phage/plasmid primase-like uncharacterized protein
MLDPNNIARARTVDILAVATHYGARLRKAGGGEFAGPCPVCGGRDRFNVNIRKGIWICRGCGKGGDVIDLLCHLDGCNFKEAIAQLTGEAWPTPQFAAAPPQRQRAQASPHRAAALRIWHYAGSIFGTPAQTYLTNTRGIDLAQIPDIDEVLRYHTACPLGAAQRLPCLIALIRDVQTNAPIGIMRTPLSADGRKAPVPNEDGEPIDRWALGDKAGGAIKLWPDAAVTTGLVVGEGLETVAAAATRIKHRDTLLQPAWALIDKGNLKYFPPLSGIEDLIILVDNDLPDQHGRLAGQEAARACAQAWLDAGHFVELLTPRLPGADFNIIAMTEPPL